MSLISTSKLLQSCIEANFKGCKVIQEYYKSSSRNNIAGDDDGITKGILKEAGNLKSIVTQADLDAQHQIVTYLHSIWGTTLRIIGEEDEKVETEEEEVYEEEVPSSASPTNNNPQETLVPSDIPMDEITLFVDPLDGTREFVEGRIENVACLIGIAWKGKSIGGVVGIPFSHNLQGTKKDHVENSNIQFYYASLSQGNHNKNDGSNTQNHNQQNYWNLGSCLSTHIPNENTLFTSSTLFSSQQQQQQQQTMSEDNIQPKISFFTGDSYHPILNQATEEALNIAHTLLSSTASTSSFSSSITTTTTVQKIQKGGTASKMVAVSTIPYSMAILHFKTCLWDTCATEAFVHARGGKVTDLFGRPLMYYPPGSATCRNHNNNKKKNTDTIFGNVYGVVISSKEPLMTQIHDTLCMKMLQDEVVVQTLLHSQK